jgi:hypothetical protein
MATYDKSDVSTFHSTIEAAIITANFKAYITGIIIIDEFRWHFRANKFVLYKV